MKLLYIDLFCGAGGTSTGVEKARLENEQCAKVIACVNHDKNAIASHAANHPDALHFTEDIRTLNLSPLVSHLQKCRAEYPEALIVLWASLECTNFSKAKGGQPRDADSRTLAEHLFRYIEAINPDYIQIENVEEFMSWGDLDEYGKPISRDKGKSYLRWLDNVRSYGYKFEHKILNSADYGAYISRKRFFGIFAKGSLPIVFPEQTHSKKPDQKLKNWKAVRDVLDFDDEGKSIFGRKTPLVDSSLLRIYAGLIKFVAGGKDAFMVKYNSMSKAGKYNAPGVDDPCPVISTQNRLGVACINRLNILTGKAFISVHYGNGFCKSVDEPAPTVTTKDRFSLISSVFIDQQYGNSKPSSLDKPLGCITVNPKYSLVSCKPWILDTNFKNVGTSINQPAPVITANRKWHYLMNPQFNSAGGSVDKPCFTLIARMDKMPPYLIEASREGDLPSFIKMFSGGLVYEIYDTDTDVMKKIKEFMAMYGISDIKMRMLTIPELKRIMGFPEDYMLIGTKAEQKKYIGNAVEVNMARVLCEALCKILVTTQRKVA
ncbi:DNA cytosine methyltransferase [Bacteroides ovatus]|nr:DNA cytosine methyltransferase [Bacteroides ovatus]